MSSKRISVYKVEKIEWVTRGYKHFDRINSRKVSYWNANIDGKIEVDGMHTRKAALAQAEKIISLRG